MPGSRILKYTHSCTNDVTGDNKKTSQNARFHTLKWQWPCLIDGWCAALWRYFQRWWDSRSTVTWMQTGRKNTINLMQDLPAVHRGFLDRARKVPMENLLSFAQRQNKKLLLTGHVSSTILPRCVWHRLQIILVLNSASFAIQTSETCDNHSLWIIKAHRLPYKNLHTILALPHCKVSPVWVASLTSWA